jgi:hypothetical protein
MRGSQMLSVVGVLAVAAGAALAQPVWYEVGDAPDTMPGQLITWGAPGDPITRIIGTLSGPDDVDIYWFEIIDAMGFAATTSAFGLPYPGGLTSFDSQLFLFDVAGVGMAHNDDSYGGLASSLGVPNFPGAGPGLVPPSFGPMKVGLAISSYNNDPVDPLGFSIWLNTPFGLQRGLDGAGAGGVLAGWTGGGGGFGAYEIVLEGVVTSIPSPGSMALMGVGVLFAMRRRR